MQSFLEITKIYVTNNYPHLTFNSMFTKSFNIQLAAKKKALATYLV